MHTEDIIQHIIDGNIVDAKLMTEKIIYSKLQDMIDINTKEIVSRVYNDEDEELDEGKLKDLITKAAIAVTDPDLPGKLATKITDWPVDAALKQKDQERKKKLASPKYKRERQKELEDARERRTGKRT
jgi:hypothetical protein